MKDIPDNIYYILLATLFGICLSTTICFCIYHTEKTEQTAMQNGYIQQPKAGKEGCIWIKPTN